MSLDNEDFKGQLKKMTELVDFLCSKLADKPENDCLDTIPDPRDKNFRAYNTRNGTLVLINRNCALHPTDYDNQAFPIQGQYVLNGKWVKSFFRADGSFISSNIAHPLDLMHPNQEGKDNDNAK